MHGKRTASTAPGWRWGVAPARAAGTAGVLRSARGLRWRQAWASVSRCCTGSEGREQLENLIALDEPACASLGAFAGAPSQAGGGAGLSRCPAEGPAGSSPPPPWPPSASRLPPAAQQVGRGRWCSLAEAAEFLTPDMRTKRGGCAGARPLRSIASLATSACDRRDLAPCFCTFPRKAKPGHCQANSVREAAPANAAFRHFVSSSCLGPAVTVLGAGQPGLSPVSPLPGVDGPPGTPGAHAARPPHLQLGA